MTNPHFALTQNTLAQWEKTPSLIPDISGLFECHIFCSPLNPSREQKELFVKTCEKAQINALCLGLDYETKGVINVLQSTKYYESESPQNPVAWMLRDASLLAQHLDVIRLKLEAMSQNNGVPRTDEEARALPASHYFEYHIKLDAPVSEENDSLLKSLARELTSQLNIKIPFSCNNMGHKNQRFLNARTYQMGSISSDAQVARIEEALTQRGFRVSKIIREFIVFDTNKDLDRGWLEF